MTVPNETIFQLAKGVQQSFPAAQSYGRVRSKLEKQGWSEILLYKAVADHCDENCIDPKSMIPETKELLIGCSQSLNHLNNDNNFPFLRGQFHQLQNGDMSTGGVKSPEQRGRFLCNCCYIVKEKNERSIQRSSKNSCQVCVRAQSKAHNDKTRKSTIERNERHRARDEAKENGEPTAFQQGVEAPRGRQPISPVIQAKEIVAAQEEFQPEPIITHEEVTMLNEHIPANKATTAEITEVIADAKTASITITCASKELHLVLSALAEVTA